MKSGDRPSQPGYSNTPLIQLSAINSISDWFMTAFPFPGPDRKGIFLIIEFRSEFIF